MSTTTATAPRRPPTAAQGRILDRIAELTAGGRPGPTYRELAAACGLSNTNGVVCHVTALRRKGWVRTPADGSSRGLCLADMPPVTIPPLPPADVLASLRPEVRWALDAIRAAWTEKGRSPSQREIRDACGYRSVASAQRSVAALAALGLIRREYYRARTLVLVDVTPEPGP